MKMVFDFDFKINLHAGLYKRDPKDFRHNYIWIQIQLKREFDRISTEYSPDKLTKTEDIEHTISFVTKQILDMFAMAIKLDKKDVLHKQLENLRVKTKFMALKTQKLYKVFEDLTSDTPRPPKSINCDTNAQLSETIYSETE